MKSFKQFVESATVRYKPNAKASGDNPRKVQQMMFDSISLIPLTPSIVKLINDDIKPMTSIHITDISNAANVFKNQNKKVTNICTMAIKDAKQIQIDGGGVVTGNSCYMKITGTPLAVSNVDLWSMPDIEGRRWIGYRSLVQRSHGQSYEDELRSKLDTFWKDYDKMIDNVWKFARNLCSKEDVILPNEKDGWWAIDNTIQPKTQASIIKEFFNGVATIVKKHKSTLKWYFFAKPDDFDIAKGPHTDGPGWSEIILTKYKVEYALLSMGDYLIADPAEMKSERAKTTVEWEMKSGKKKFNDYLKPIFNFKNVYGMILPDYRRAALADKEPSKEYLLSNFQAQLAKNKHKHHLVTTY